jgi:hypothetical protein
MPRKTAPIPPITAVPRDLTVEDVRGIIETAERAQERRAVLAREMRAALDAGDTAHVMLLAQQIVEEEPQEQ